MEAPLHQSPVPPPPLLQQARAMVDAQIKPPPPPPPPAMVGREQCPRCASRDTKFCYYNNYNTAQPRHFCRACRRYWTLGGSLRNVPVGGSTRKRPRPTHPTRAIAAAVATAAAAASSASPFFASSPVAAPAASSLAPPPPTASLQGGILGSLLLGAAPPLLALGATPLLQGRLAGLGLGQPDQLLLPGAGDLAQLAFGAGPLLWPAAATVLEGDRAFPLPPPASLWQELASAAPPVEAGGLHRGCSPHLLL